MVAKLSWRCVLCVQHHQKLFFSPKPRQFSTRLSKICRDAQLKQALWEMATLGFAMKFRDYDLVLTECINKRSIRDGQLVHAHMIKTDYKAPVYLGTRLLVFYNKCDLLEDARRVFDEMPERNVVSWTAMISAYSQGGCGSDALDLFVQMLRSGVEANEFTLSTVLTSCKNACGFDFGRQVHSMIIKSKFEEHVFVGSSLLDMYAKNGKLHEAQTVFESLPERDVVSCTAFIAGYAQLGFDKEALELFRELQRDGMCSNYVTYTGILTAVSGLAAFNHGREVHGHVLRLEFPFYVVLENSLIDMYSKCGKLDYSRRIFDHMSERTTISWNAMLVCYGKHGMGRQVVELFRLMEDDVEVKPDRTTLLSVLSGCSHGGLHDRGVEILGKMVKGVFGIAPDIQHYGCVVDLLGRAGLVERAYELIEQMPFEPTPAILGSLLGACSVHSNVNIGILVGCRLLEVEPENAGHYVILSNLYASSGRWEEALHLRELMTEKTVRKEPAKAGLN